MRPLQLVGMALYGLAGTASLKTRWVPAGTKPLKRPKIKGILIGSARSKAPKKQD